MLKSILSVSGKPGLFKLVSHGKNLLIIESLTDNKRIPAHARDKVISLGDIAIYTDDSEIPLYEVLEAVKVKEDSKVVSIDIVKASADELRAYFAEILPNFDRDRVYPTDIKRLLKWYDILLGAGITDYAPILKEDDTNEKTEELEDNITEEEKSVKEKVVKAKKTTTKKPVSVAKKTTEATPKPSAAAKKPAQRTRQK